MEEGKDVAQMCNFISELYCVQRGGVGRVSSDGIEPVTFGLLVQHSTTVSPGNVMKKEISGK